MNGEQIQTGPRVKPCNSVSFFSDYGLSEKRNSFTIMFTFFFSIEHLSRRKSFPIFTSTFIFFASNCPHMVLLVVKTTVLSKVCTLNNTCKNYETYSHIYMYNVSKKIFV